MSQFIQSFFMLSFYLFINLNKSRTSRREVNTLSLVDLMVTLESALGHSPVNFTALLAACTHGC